jgi:hypothetical protein
MNYIFILILTKLDALNFIMSLFHASTCFEHTCQETKIVLYSLWYHHTYRWPSRAQVEMHGQQNIKIYEL